MSRPLFSPYAEADAQQASYTSEAITFHSGDFTLVGELKIPRGNEPHGVVILFTGTGLTIGCQAVLIRPSSSWPYKGRPVPYVLYYEPFDDSTVVDNQCIEMYKLSLTQAETVERVAIVPFQLNSDRHDFPYMIACSMIRRGRSFR